MGFFLLLEANKEAGHQYGFLQIPASHASPSDVDKKSCLEKRHQAP